MPFTLIEGTFHLVHPGPSGNPTGFEPDGDSVHFKPKNPSLLNLLTKIGKPYKPSNIGSVNLRLEGIDALELHFTPQVKGSHETHQPRPLADDSRGFLTKELGLDPVQYVPPKLTRVKPPAPNDGAPGFILSRSLDIHGRPVSFVFTGELPADDGSPFFLKPSFLKKSLNYKSVLNGFAYPLFYDNFFKELRDVFSAAAVAARNSNPKRGIWKKDKTTSGVVVNNQADLETNGFIFPKLFRRLSSYLAEGNSNLSQFRNFPELTKEQVQDLDPNSPTFTNFTHFDSMVRVSGNKVRLKQKPETILFVSAK